MRFILLFVALALSGPVPGYALEQGPLALTSCRKDQTDDFKSRFDRKLAGVTVEPVEQKTPAGREYLQTSGNIQSDLFSLGLSPVTGAKKAREAPDQSYWRRICATFGQVAEKIMTDRQGSVSRAKMLQSIQGDYLLEYIVIEAYKVPKVPDDRMQRSVEEFRDRIYLECVDAAKLE